MHSEFLLTSILLIGTCAGQANDLIDLISSVFKTDAPVKKAIPTTTPYIIAPVPQTGIPSTEGTFVHSYNRCGAGKECVQGFVCSNAELNENGALLIDLRALNEECPFGETCCSIDDNVSDSEYMLTSKIILCHDEPIIEPMESLKACGYRNYEGIGFRIEGEDTETNFGEFPWMVAILREHLTDGTIVNMYQCGGSLITPKVALTAAHCVQAWPANILKVRAGEWQTDSKAELYPDQDRQVVERIVHKDFNKGSLYNDIALLFLDIAFDLAPNVNTICLPPAALSFDFSRCYVTGWGKDRFYGGEYQTILKKINLPVIPNDQCQMNLRRTRLGKFFELHRSFMCAGGERGKDSCKGDGGSPLVCPMKENMDRIGCGEENIPGTYASVPYLRGWIDEQLAYRGIHNASFTV